MVLAAGMGSRYGGMKQIDPVGPCSEFIIDYSCHDAVMSGFDHIVFVIKKENLEIFRETVGARVEPHVKVSYAFQDMDDLPDGFYRPEGRVKPWGTAHALLACRDIVKDCFATVNADDFYGRDAFMRVADFLKNVSPDSSPARCCLCAYRLSNTLTDSGSVSRGICKIKPDGRLESITERTAITPLGADAEFEENGIKTFLPGDSPASMNLFGATPAIFSFAENGFKDFLVSMPNPQKSEYYLPFMLSDAMNSGFCTIDVLKTTAKWFGVTYAADRENVRENIAALIKDGVYRENLWSDL